MATRKQNAANKATKKDPPKTKSKKASDILKQADRQDQMTPSEEVSPHRKEIDSDVPHCGLCGASQNLTRTDCCGEWICNDEESYVMFSFAENSCFRNHERYTLCGIHHTESHAGRWQDCLKCRKELKTEMYVYYGTNEFNFEVLENPPKYKPTHCILCGEVIVLADGGYSSTYKGYQCWRCTFSQSTKQDE